MSNILYKVGSELLLEGSRQESIARNLAGSNIPGYRREIVVSRSFEQELDDSRIENFSNLRGVGRGERVIDFTQGPIKDTGRSLDFAIVGDGFFEVQMEKGASYYTRNGSFTVSAKGELTTPDGALVMGKTGKIVFDTTDDINDIRVGENGTLTIQSGTAKKFIGELKVVDITDKTALERVNANYFMLNSKDTALAKEASSYRLVNGKHETANFSPIQEMSHMIGSLREFEINQKVLQMNIRLLETVNRIMT